MRYLPGFSAFLPILPLKGTTRLPPAWFLRTRLPWKTRRLQFLRARFLRVGLTHFLPAFLPFTLRSTRIRTVAAVLSVNRIFVPAGVFLRFLAATLAVAF